MISNGAMFMARVLHNAYQRADDDAVDWDSLTEEHRQAMGEAFQTLIDIHVLEPISLQGVRALKIAGLMPESIGVQGS